jgi:hypothetical protein
MANISVPPTADNTSLGSRSIALILGMACILVFLAAIATFSIPPDPMALEWRVAFMQQVSARIIILFLGAALILFSLLGRGSLSRYFALTCLVVGLLLPLSCLLVVRDSLKVQSQVFTDIDERADQVQEQLQVAENNPDLPAEITPEQLDAAVLAIDDQAENLRQNTRNDVSKSMVSVAGKLIVFGMGFVGLGRFGIRHTA